ncbi:MAG TPA: PIN domain-containing protein [Acidimicrobiales bacterium]|nr:PIN domain-containing protein [Acidimicrobiales bacterium]
MTHLRPKPGRTCAEAARQLDILALEAHNAITQGGHPVGKVLPRYIEWVEKAERQLRSLFVAREPIDHLIGVRYWHLRSLRYGAERAFNLIEAEVEAQREYLTRHAAALQQLHDAHQLPAGTVAVVPDTNVFLHYDPFDQLPWCKEVGARRVRLVLPLPVIDELDAQTYARDERVRRRAKAALRRLRELRGLAEPTAVVPVTSTVDLQVMADSTDPVTHDNGDREILSHCELLQTIVGEGSVIVATGDNGMQLRAQLLGLRGHLLSEELRSQRED